ncbi:Serine/threonine-protein kinase PrkC [Gemmata sp. SH-PL17]|uniref:serine/threonine-protein kinase n=1 Tax=Gemmata sp. SH-PL17 TaxID=1630693 RepID=UPI00078D3B5F|nr:serine/threonine-protein kinase [Gemmata sp. SH-PL17]AMV28064.1 Serine/threonine-protein kinase PrkC [Gemmata sp. SH-PL17]
MTGMTADPPLGTFLATLRRSRLLDPPDLDRLTTRHNPTSARAFADALVRTGILTHYQAEKLLNGHWYGLVLGPYSVLAPLGRGGMGTVVYLARDRRLSAALGDSELVALKILTNRKAEREPKALRRFRREMVLGRRVDHPNVVRTFVAGELDDVYYTALEYIPGRTVRQLVQEAGPLAVGDAARIFADVAAGLAHVHERGLIHRDVKPSNVIVRPDGRAVLLDLGLALVPGEQLPTDPTIVGGRGYTVGTMDYLAPEQARDASTVGPAADLYSLGCSLVFALTGSVPFPAPTAKEKIARHRSDWPPALEQVPQEFARIVHRLMAKSPEMRYGTASEVRDLLAKWATSSQTRTPIDAIVLADTPGNDTGLWELVPGEDLPETSAGPGWELVHNLDDTPGSIEVLEIPPEKPSRSGCLTAGALFALLGFVVTRVV